MALKPLTPMQQTRIVNNVVKACSDIEQLNSTGYKYLYLCSGFIAHYNLYGFINYYSNSNLKRDILNNERFNMWTNFKPEDRDYDYYMSKAQVYQRIIKALV
jgi:hypothetical protein